jgi:hypothetical protein
LARGRAGHAAFTAGGGISGARPDDRAERTAYTDSGERGFPKAFQHRTAGRLTGKIFGEAIEA